MLHAQRFELKDLRTRDERTVDVEKRIVSGRSNQPQVSTFDIGQENILLRFVEMMDFVDKQNRFLSGSAKTIGCRGDHTPHFRDIAFHTAQAHEPGVRHVGDDMRKGCLAGPRRPGENHGGQTVGFDRAAQQLARRENMFLADKFLERPRPHAGGERRSAGRAGKIDIFLFAKEIVHGKKYGGAGASASQFQSMR